jgi:hypothetical protein
MASLDEVGRNQHTFVFQFVLIICFVLFLIQIDELITIIAAKIKRNITVCVSNTIKFMAEKQNGKKMKEINARNDRTGRNTSFLQKF